VTARRRRGSSSRSAAGRGQQHFDRFARAAGDGVVRQWDRANRGRRRR
jgi:hypothetical protein